MWVVVQNSEEDHMEMVMMMMYKMELITSDEF